MKNTKHRFVFAFIILGITILLSGCGIIPSSNKSILTIENLHLLEVSMTYEVSGGSSLQEYGATETLRVYNDAVVVKSEISGDRTLYADYILDYQDDELLYLERYSLESSSKDSYVLIEVPETYGEQYSSFSEDVLFYLDEFESEINGEEELIIVPVDTIIEQYPSTFYIIEALFGVEITESDKYKDLYVEYGVIYGEDEESIEIDMSSLINAISTDICHSQYGEEAQSEDICSDKTYYLSYSIEVKLLDETSEYERPNFVADDAPSIIYMTEMMSSLPIAQPITLETDFAYDVDYLVLNIETDGEYIVTSDNPNMEIAIYDEELIKKGDFRDWMYDLYSDNQLNVYLEKGKYYVEFFSDSVLSMGTHTVEVSQNDPLDDFPNSIQYDSNNVINDSETVSFIKENEIDIDSIYFEETIDSITFILEDGVDFYSEYGYVSYMQVDNEYMYIRVDKTEGGPIDINLYNDNDVSSYDVSFTIIDNTIDELDFNDFNNEFHLNDEDFWFVASGNVGSDNEVYKLDVDFQQSYLVHVSYASFSIYEEDGDLVYEGYESANIELYSGTYYINIHTFMKPQVVVYMDRTIPDVENDYLMSADEFGVYDVLAVVSYHGDVDTFVFEIDTTGIYYLELESDYYNPFFVTSENDETFRFFTGIGESTYLLLEEGTYTLESEYMTNVGDYYTVSLSPTEFVDIDYTGEFSDYDITEELTTSIELSFDAENDIETLVFNFSDPVAIRFIFDNNISTDMTFVNSEGEIDINHSASGLVTYDTGTVTFDFKINSSYVDQLEGIGIYTIEIEIVFLTG